MQNTNIKFRSAGETCPMIRISTPFPFTAELSTNSLVDFVVFWNYDIQTVFYAVELSTKKMLILKRRCHPEHRKNIYFKAKMAYYEMQRLSTV